MAGRSRIPYLSTYTTSIDDTQHVFANISRIIDCDINLSYLIPVEVTRQLSAIQLLVTYTLNMNCVTNNNTPLFGVSDASVKMGNRQHAWVFTTGAKQYFGDPKMMIRGTGVINGHPFNTSSTRAELHGQTAIAIMAKSLLQQHNAFPSPMKFSCDNEGIL